MTWLKVTGDADQGSATTVRPVYRPYEALPAFLVGRVCDDTSRYVRSRGALRLDLTVVDESGGDWDGTLPATLRCRAIAVFRGHEVSGDSDPFSGSDTLYSDNRDWWVVACERLRGQFEPHPVEDLSP